MAEVCAVIDGILAIIHPKLAHAGASAMAKIKKEAASRSSDDPHSASSSSISCWPTVFNAIHVICNRATIYHRDKNALPGWFDGLLSVGDYERGAVLSFRNLGFCVPYDSGSLAFLSSRVVVHGVPDVDGNRLCLAFIMDESVHSHYQVPSPGWSRFPKVIPGMSGK